MLLAVCAGEARVAASGPGESVGPDEVFEDPMFGRRQVMMSAHLMSDPLFGYELPAHNAKNKNECYLTLCEVRG